MLDTADEVIRALVTYTDWWQPSTASVLQVGAARRSSSDERGFSWGTLETLDERRELSARAATIPERDRLVLFLWYVKQLAVEDVARAVGISRRQCFRRRAAAVRAIVEASQDGPTEAKA